jgi:hypothetical protein
VEDISLVGNGGKDDGIRTDKIVTPEKRREESIIWQYVFR